MTSAKYCHCPRPKIFTKYY